MCGKSTGAGGGGPAGGAALALLLLMLLARFTMGGGWVAAILFIFTKTRSKVLRMREGVLRGGVIFRATVGRQVQRLRV